MKFKPFKVITLLVALITLLFGDSLLSKKNPKSNEFEILINSEQPVHKFKYSKDKNGNQSIEIGTSNSDQAPKIEKGDSLLTKVLD